MIFFFFWWRSGDFVVKVEKIQNLHFVEEKDKIEKFNFLF